MLSIELQLSKLSQNDKPSYVKLRNKLVKQFETEIKNEQMEQLCIEAKTNFNCQSWLEHKMEFLKYDVTVSTELYDISIICMLFNNLIKIEATFNKGDYSSGHYICLKCDNIIITDMSEELRDLSDIFTGVVKLKRVYNKLQEMNYGDIPVNYDFEKFVNDLNTLVVKLQSFEM